MSLCVLDASFTFQWLLEDEAFMAALWDQFGEEPFVDVDIAFFDDPSMAGSRNVDWEEFLRNSDQRYRGIVKAIAEGKRPGEVAATVGLTYVQLQWIRLNLAADLLDHMGEQILDESVQAPAWRGDLRAASLLALDG